MKPYKLSPTTGTITSDKIVARPLEESKLRSLLESQSVVIEEFRRMGKTLFLMKFVHNSTAQYKAIYFSLQGVKDVGELTDMLLSDLRKEQKWGKLKIGFNAIRKLWNNFKPEEVDLGMVSFKLPEWKNRWKDALVACFQDIAERNHDEDETLTLVLDEFTVMLWDWIQAGKATEAIEFLDILRKQRQILESVGKVRFVVCGSIGLRVVLKHLQDKFNYTGEPFNDTETFMLEGMQTADAMFLCECLYLSDFTIKQGENQQELFEKICQKTERLPFYINKIFTIIKQNYDNELSTQNIEKAFGDLFIQPHHNKIFKQLIDRINIYYPDNEANIMLDLLKKLARAEGELSEEAMVENVEAEPKNIEEALNSLVIDQYLRFTYNQGTRHYSFKYQLIKQWWKINKA